MATPPAVLFDLDGTLSDNHDGITRSIRHALARLGVAIPDAATLRGCIGPPLRETFARFLGTSDPARIEAAIAHYRERYRDVGWQENVIYPGVPEMLTVVARQARIFVCTSKPAVFATRIVAHFAFDAHVERVYGADLDGRLDDKRKLLAHLIATERLHAAGCTMVGDRAQDIRAARANGTRAIGVLWGYGGAAELAQADLQVEEPAALPPAIFNRRATRTR